MIYQQSISMDKTKEIESLQITNDSLRDRIKKTEKNRKDILNKLDVLYEQCYIVCPHCLMHDWDEHTCENNDAAEEFKKLKNGIADLLTDETGWKYSKEI